MRVLLLIQLLARAGSRSPQRCRDPQRGRPRDHRFEPYQHGTVTPHKRVPSETQRRRTHLAARVHEGQLVGLARDPDAGISAHSDELGSGSAPGRPDLCRLPTGCALPASAANPATNVPSGPHTPPSTHSHLARLLTAWVRLLAPGRLGLGDARAADRMIRDRSRSVAHPGVVQKISARRWSPSRPPSCSATGQYVYVALRLIPVRGRPARV